MTKNLNAVIFVVAALLAGVIVFVRQRVGRRRLAANVPLPPTFSKRWWESARQLWRTEIRPNERHMMQVVVGVAGMVVSLALGYGYADIIWVTGWQLWMWAAAVGVVTAALLSWANRPRLGRPSRRTVGLAVAGFVVVVLLRVLFLETVPGGLHVDEMGVADFAARHVFPGTGQTLNPFVTGVASQPTLYHYLTRLAFLLFGYSITGLRLSNAIAGSLGVVATYAAISQLANRRTALFGAALMATYHYHIHWSRLGLNNVWDTLWAPLLLAAFVWGWRKGWSGGAVLAGLALGLSQYFYAGNKIGLFLLAYVMVVLYRQEPGRQETARQKMLVHGGKLVITAVTVAAPITLFALLKPDVYLTRTYQVMGWQSGYIIDAIGEYNLWRYLGHQLWRNLGAFTAVPEITGFYGPGVPFLIGLAAPLFIAGILWSLWKRQFVPVLWVLLTVFFGGILLGGSPSSSHYVVVIPAICWLTAVPLNWLWENGQRRLSLFLLIAIMATDLIFYFGVYVPSGPRDLFNAMPPWPLP